MQSLREFLTDRLTAVAEEIFEAVERTILEYKEDIFRSKDLEISRLRMQLKLLSEDPGPSTDRCDESLALQLPHHPDHPITLLPPSPPQQHHQSPPAVSAPEQQLCEDSSMEEEQQQQQPESSHVKQENQHYWINQDGEALETLDFISPPSTLKPDIQEQTVYFHPFLNITGGEESKPYCCSVCKKRFNNCSHLAAHIRTHTGERPYKCDICMKTFITTSALNRHQTIHTEGKQFVCNYCGKSFKWMESLGRHIRSTHRGDHTTVRRLASHAAN